MPSPSPGKCRGSIVRQLSLQSQTSLQSSGGPRGLKKQLSEDDARTMGLVEVTGQAWPGTNERPESILRVGPGDFKFGPGKIPGPRPKPVKVAWADKKQENMECPSGVEVVATKCPGQPRPMSVKTQRLKNPLLGNKDTLVYSKLQLAERLRNAWSEREKMKPNINIFLAQGASTTRSDLEPDTDRSSTEVTSVLSDSTPLDKKRKSTKVRALSRDFPHSAVKLQEGFFISETETVSKEDCTDKSEEQTSPRNEEEREEDAGRYLQEFNRIEVRVTKIERSEETTEEETKDNSENQESPINVKRCRNKENIKSSSADAESDKKDTTVQDRRANFRRSVMLHKTISESFTKEDEPKAGEGAPEVKIPLKPSLKKPPLLRAFSAPSQNDDPSDPLKIQKKVKIVTQRKLQPTVSFDISCTNTNDVAAMRERIKSAPIRRKLKSAAVRRKNKEKESSDEEKDIKESTSSKKSTRRSHSRPGGDIVTMVSLVSPAESDTEDSVNLNLPLESWRGAEKEEANQNGPNSTSGKAEESEAASFVLQKFVSLRKTKSVSFQPHPVLNRGYSASFPSRRAPAGTPIVIPTPVISNPALTPAQILEREKRSFAFSAISSGTDGRGTKRRLLRSSTEPPKEEDCYREKERSPGSNLQEEAEKEKGSGEGETSGEPEFKSDKERECWNLYQKMLDKGVSVSFDTVLRGMLTPTEYRLRKNSLLSSC